mgnify:CR=1 FL=1
MKKVYLIPLTLVGLCSITSCGPKASGDPRVVDVFMNEGNTLSGAKKDSIWQEIEKKTNTTINISGATHGSDYYSNLNLQLNNPKSFKYDIVFSVPSNNDAHYQSHIDDDLYWNIDELLAMKPGQYPNIEKIIHSEKYKNITYGEKYHTLVPFATSNSGWTIYYRSDWLINIGYVNPDGSAKVPTTMSEFQDVLEKFTNGNPDKDPSHATYGLSPAGSFFYWSPLYHAFGVTPDYDLDSNDNVTYMYTQAEFRNFLTWAHDMYSKGYIDPNFSANVPNDGDREKFYNGDVGVLITNGENHVSWIAPGTEQIQGKNKIICGPAPIGDSKVGKEGAGGFSDWGGWWGGYSIFKRRTGSSSYDTASAFAALDVLEYLNSQEGGLTRTYGIKDTHWEYGQKNKIVPLYEARNDEPDKTFTRIKQENGSYKLSGLYRMGNGWGNRINWVDDTTFETVITSENVDFDYKELFKQTVDNCKTVGSRLTNFTNYASGYDEKMNLFEDELDTYANAVVRGIPGTRSWEDEITRLNSTFYWGDIQTMIKEQAKKAGIID